MDADEHASVLSLYSGFWDCERDLSSLGMQRDVLVGMRKRDGRNTKDIEAQFDKSLSAARRSFRESIEFLQRSGHPIPELSESVLPYV